MSATPIHMQYDDAEQQAQSYSAGMWVYLASEIMFFGVLFLSYGILRARFPVAFAAAGQTMKQTIGSINTLVLLTSSFTMAAAVHLAREHKTKKQMGFLIVTMVLGAIFLGLKIYEWTLDAGEMHLPGPGFHWADPSVPAVQAELFYFLYFAITFVHALHLSIGILVVGTLTYLCWRGRDVVTKDASPTELVGLYWHYVDIIWIFLYPLLYLIPPPR